jgi:predicted carbohydrate-binding protein with CBM5 and CBM33 domain
MVHFFGRSIEKVVQAQTKALAQRMMHRVVVGLLVLATGVSGHNWLSAPISRDGSLSTAQNTNDPCDSGAPRFTTVKRGEQVQLAWTQNHAAPLTHTIHLFKGSSPPTGRTGAGSLYTFTQDMVGSEPRLNFKHTITIPSDALGPHVLQYNWANYYSCTDFLVVDNSTGVGISTTGTATTGVAPTTTGSTTGVATTTTGVAVVATTGTTTGKSGGITSGAPRAEFAARRQQWWVSIMSMLGIAALCR